jgi:metal-dependent amidase/aminoacylase/carboxypeptidase family protein
VGSFSSGTAPNIIPQTAKLTGTIRALTKEVRKLLHTRLRELATGLATTFDVRIDLNISDGYPPTINDARVSEFIHQVAVDILGPDKVEYLRPTTGAEDFAYYAQKIPGSIFRIGCGSPGHENPLHSPYFNPDEDALAVGVEIVVEAVKRELG